MGDLRDVIGEPRLVSVPRCLDPGCGAGRDGPLGVRPRDQLLPRRTTGTPRGRNRVRVAAVPIPRPLPGGPALNPALAPVKPDPRPGNPPSPPGLRGGSTKSFCTA